jgi:hypothetical protein
LKKSPTDFARVFKNHDPLRVFEILLQSLNELNQKRQVRLKWTKSDPATLTVTFQTKVGVRTTNATGHHGKARCVASSPSGTELQLVLLPAGSKFMAAMSGPGGRDGQSMMSRRGYDMGERQAIWDSIIKEVTRQLSPHSPPTPPPSAGKETLAENRPPPIAQVIKDAGDDSKESATIEGSVQSETATGPGPTAEPQRCSTEMVHPTRPTDVTATSLPLGERLDLIERLGSLKDRGHLSSEEFSEQKTRLIYGS